MQEVQLQEQQPGGDPRVRRRPLASEFSYYRETGRADPERHREPLPDHRRRLLGGPADEHAETAYAHRSPGRPRPLGHQRPPPSRQREPRSARRPQIVGQIRATVPAGDCVTSAVTSTTGSRTRGCVQTSVRSSRSRAPSRPTRAQRRHRAPRATNHLTGSSSARDLDAPGPRSSAVSPSRTASCFDNIRPIGNVTPVRRGTAAHRHAST